MEEEFPSNLELTAASALLLLSLPKTSSTTTQTTTTTTTTTITATSPLSKLEEENVEAIKTELWSKKSDYEVIEKSSFENSIVTSTPCLSSLTNDDSVDSHRFKLMASAVAHYRDMALKVVRRARSKVIYRGITDKKPSQKMWGNPPLKNPNKASTSTSQALTEGTTTTESSCLSSGGTSEISSARTEGKAVVVEQRRRRGSGSTYISRRADAILRVLSYKGCASEVRIRQLLGDSPDTSKALRMLLRMDEVKRRGAGGRLDPYIYMIAADSGSMVT